MSAIIQVDRVSKSFGGVRANIDISLTVEEDGITGLIGPNGSGKTTLFNSIVGYHPIDGGSIKFRDREISKMLVPEIARLGLLRTFQQTRIYGKMDCVQNMLISLPHRKAKFLEMFRRERGAAQHNLGVCITKFCSNGRYRERVKEGNGLESLHQIQLPKVNDQKDGMRDFSGHFVDFLEV